jgi:hypothetical protein
MNSNEINEKHYSSILTDDDVVRVVEEHHGQDTKEGHDLRFSKDPPGKIYDTLLQLQNKSNDIAQHDNFSLSKEQIIDVKMLSDLSEEQVSVLSRTEHSVKSVREQHIKMIAQDMDSKSLKEIFKKEGYHLHAMRQSPIERIQNLNPLQLFYLGALVIPTIISLWYASAILFPPTAREKASFFLWTDGAMMKNDQGQLSICPRSSICAEGLFQIILIILARLSAFASYVAMGLTFLSKMHSMIHFLSTTYLSTMIPFESMHDVHKMTGRMFACLALLHTVTHYIRYIVRRDIGQLGSTVHISGLIAFLILVIVILSMSRFIKERLPFENRFNAHWLFPIVILALFLHTPRTRNIVMVFL